MTTPGNCHNPGLYVDAKSLCFCKVKPSQGSVNLMHVLSPRGQAGKKRYATTIAKAGTLALAPFALTLAEENV